jgi:glutaredoxin-like protein NrdH
VTAGRSGSRVPRFLLSLVALGAVFALLAGCTGTTSSPEQGTGPVVTTPSVPSWVVHVAGNDRGSVLLVGRKTCPWCMKTKELLANMTVDYYWVDLDTLDQAQTAEVMKAVRVCGQTSSVPILVINGERCIIGFQEAQIRGVLG